MEITQEMIEQATQGAVKSVREQLVRDLTAAIDYDIRQSIADQISAHVSTWIEENVLPDITTGLVEGKPGLVVLGKDLAHTVVQEVASKMTDDVKKRVDDSWTRRKIYEALFR